MPYELYYWPGLQGRGEFIRLALEDAGADYIDVARGPEKDGRGIKALMGVLAEQADPMAPFAPPFLRDGTILLSQVANILFYLGPKLGLAPADEALSFVANGLQLTIADAVAEVHDTHHPIDVGLRYEDQKPAAKERAAGFVKDRIPKFLGYFEAILQANGAAHIVGSDITYVDLSVFQLIEGLRYAFPKAMKGTESQYPGLAALHDLVCLRPNIARYLASERRLAFNETGIFRHYPELDEDRGAPPFI